MTKFEECQNVIFSKYYSGKKMDSCKFGIIKYFYFVNIGVCFL